MTAMRELLIDAAVGETRTALIEGGRIAEIHVDRWSEAGRFAAAGVRYRVRVASIDRARGGAFVDLGVGPAGWMPLSKDRKDVTEGAAVEARVRAEAHADKGPLMVFEALAEPGANAPELLSGEASWGARFPEDEIVVRQAEIVDRTDIDDTIHAALGARAAIPGGGTLWIEPTRALTAIDVDSGGREMKGGKARATKSLIADAAAEIAFQTRLRGLGGLLAVDLPHLPRPARKEADAAMRKAFANDPRRVEFAGLSRFGIMEIARERAERPLAEIMLDEGGALSVESAALSALRALEREGAANRGAQLTLRAAPEVIGWLKRDTIGWRAAMTERLGPRFEIENDPEAARDRADVELR